MLYHVIILIKAAKPCNSLIVILILQTSLLLLWFAKNTHPFYFFVFRFFVFVFLLSTVLQSIFEVFKLLVTLEMQ